MPIAHVAGVPAVQATTIPGVRPPDLRASRDLAANGPAAAR
jgi:hypothetical protein